MKKIIDWFKGLSSGARVLVILGAAFWVIVFGSALNAVNSSSTNTAQKSTSQKTVESSSEEERQRLEPVIRVEEKIESVDFATRTQNDGNLAAGTTKVGQEGVVGEKKVAYKVTYIDNTEVSREKAGEVVTRTPVDKIILNGIYVAPAPESNCPNGTYTNSAGNIMCRPYESSSQPNGATARCKDGSYSFSQSRRGTCSGHGGVAQWF